MAIRHSSTDGSESEAKPQTARTVKPKEVEPGQAEAVNDPTPAMAEQKPAEETETEEVGFAPKTFLIPYVLLMLRDSLMHGYAIWEKLMLMGIPGLDEGDRATVYRTLRQLEREGKVKSEWDTNSEGPARRVYRLTDAGESFLQIWAVGLDQYRRSLDFFFKMYTNPFGLNLNDFKGGKKQ